MPSDPAGLNRLDLGKLKGYSLEVKSLDLPEILASKLRQEEADASYQRRKDLMLFLFAVLGVASVAGLCAFVVVRQASTPDDKKWATTVLFSIVTAAVGFLAGKNSK